MTLYVKQSVCDIKKFEFYHLNYQSFEIISKQAKMENDYFEPLCDSLSNLGFGIRITCLCDLYPLTPHFYIVKLGCKGVYIFFLFLL